MRVTSEGEITIPRDICDRAGFAPGSEIEFRVDETGVKASKVEAHTRIDAAARVAAFRGTATGWRSSDEVMALLRGDD